MATIRDIGVTTISVDKTTKALIKQIAGDKDIYVKMREIVDEYTENHPQEPMETGKRANIEPATKEDVRTLRSETHKLTALMLAMPFLPILNKPGELQNTIESLSSGMTEFEDVLIAKFAELPSETRQFMEKILEKSSKYEESRQGELVL